MNNVVVIGGGIAGLAAACFAAKDGHRVTILEKNEHLGGRANSFEEQGFRFDMGPSWYLMPDVFEDFFKKMNRDVHDYLDLAQLTPSYRVFFHDGTFVDITADAEEVGDLFESWETGSKKKFQQFLKTSEYAYNIAMKGFVYKNYDSLLDFFTPQILFEGAKLHIFETMKNYVGRYFKDERIKQILQYTLVFLGGAPSNTPALYNIMSHIDFNMGVWYPQGGLFEVSKALARIAEELGVESRTQVDVKKIHVDPTTKKATSVVLGTGEEIAADTVISNADYHFTEQSLLSPEWQSYSASYWETRVQAPSALILFLGLNKKLNSLQHHTLFFGKNWEEHFEEIFDTPAWPTDPSLYIGCPSKSDSSVAPEGHENLFVLVPIATGIEDTPEVRDAYTQKILQSIERYTGETIQPHIVVKRSFCITDFEEVYNTYKGSALGLAHTLFQTALFRPRNYSKKVKNLFFTGAGTVPGIGVPMCLISGELTYSRAVDSWKK